MASDFLRCYKCNKKLTLGKSKFVFVAGQPVHEGDCHVKRKAKKAVVQPNKR